MWTEILGDKDVVVTCPPIHLCHSHAISRLVGSESRIRKVEAVSSRSYFLIKSFTDLRIGVMKHKMFSWRPDPPPGSSSSRHVGTAGVRGAALTRVVQPSWLFHNEVTKPVVSVTLRQDEREQKVKDYFSVIHRVSRNICHEPMPELCQGPGENLLVL